MASDQRGRHCSRLKTALRLSCNLGLEISAFRQPFKRGHRVGVFLGNSGKKQHVPRVDSHTQPIPQGPWSVQKQKVHAGYNSARPPRYGRAKPPLPWLKPAENQPAIGLSEPLVRSVFLPFPEKLLNLPSRKAQQNEYPPKAPASPRQFRPPPQDQGLSG